jgi:hypothetical protein
MHVSNPTANAVFPLWQVPQYFPWPMASMLTGLAPAFISKIAVWHT